MTPHRGGAGGVRPAWTSLVRPALHLMMAAVLLPSAALAQAPIINAIVEHRPVTNGLAREIAALAQQGRPVWVGYRVPIVRSRGDRVTSTQTCCGRCRLEPPTDLVMLLKVDRTGVTEFRSEAVDCDIDASGSTLVWLDNVQPDDSVSWLAGVVRESSAQPSAGPTRPVGAAFSRTAPRQTEAALTALALHASPTAVPVLVDVARSAASAQARSRALFWLAQRASEEAVPTIGAEIDTDPDTDVKKQAVFALSQLPKDEGVPRLIELARTHRNPEVRKQAFFWLGQSKDPRAVDFFASILLK